MLRFILFDQCCLHSSTRITLWNDHSAIFCSIGRHPERALARVDLRCPGLQKSSRKYELWMIWDDVCFSPDRASHLDIKPFSPPVQKRLTFPYRTTLLVGSSLCGLKPS